MSACHRCDAAPDDPQGHADEAGHPLCARCGRSLRFEEAGACRVCVDRLTQNLADLLDGYEALPDAARQIGGSRHTHPGGTPLVLAGPGSEGLTGLRGAPLRTGGVDDSHALDERATDPPSVAQELGSLENDWRRGLGHEAARPPAPASMRRPRSYVNGVVRDATAYLQRHALWCASAYPDGFVEACETVWVLRQRVYGTLGWLEPRGAVARCLPCGERGAEVRLEVGGTVWVCPRCGGAWSSSAYWSGLRAAQEAAHAG